MRRSFVKRWLVPALAPMLLTLYPVLYLYVINIEKLYLGDLIQTLLLCLLATFVFFMGLSAVLRDASKGAVLTCFIVILFYAYGHVHGLFRPSSHRYLLIPWAIVFVVGTFLIIKKGSHLRILLTYLNLVASVLVVMAVGQIGIYAVNAASHAPVLVETQDLDFQPIVADELPDIYYVILDGYTRADILQEYYAHDNSAFIQALTDRGFYVPAASHSNYVLTFLSLASSLNMEYLTPQEDSSYETLTSELSIPYRLIQYGQVWRFLDEAGYTLVNLSSGWGPTDSNPYADINYAPGSLNEFQYNLIDTTLLKPFHRDWVVDSYRQRILLNFEELARISAMPEPTFTFAHFLLPHPPYVFDRNGQKTDYPFAIGGGDIWFEKAGYIDQVIFANQQLLALVDRILAESDTPPIIIFQGDHGSASSGGWAEQSPALIRERTAIFNAYYLPDTDQLYPTITPVNSFRIIFDLYFDQDFELLEDRTFFSDYVYPYRMEEVIVNGQ